MPVLFLRGKHEEPSMSSRTDFDVTVTIDLRSWANRCLVETSV
jgi:hypothetical protein